MTEKFIKMIQNDPDKFKGMLDDLVIAYEDIIHEIEEGKDIINKKENIKNDIEYIKDLKIALI